MHDARPVILLLFYLAVGGVGYAYAIYPAAVYVLGRLFGRPAAPPSIRAGEEPFISVLIAAYNEQSVIADRIENALAMDYPAGRIEIVIASDGSTDRTVEIVEQFASRGVRLLAYPVRRGKATVLNEAMREVRGSIVFLSDANTHTDRDAAQNLARWFSDAKIGAVCGKLILTDPASGQNADGIYWKYESFLKRQESRLGALLGSNGAIYAIRRELFSSIPANAIIDDFVIPLLARLRSGCHIVYDEQAIAREESAPDVGSEFRRRARIGAGGWQAIALLWPLLNPARGWIAFTFFSHKLLRWICPFLLIVAFVATLLLSGSLPFRVLLGMQMAAYLLAALGDRMPRRGLAGRVIKIVQLFVGMNLALLVGFFRWIGSPQTGMWTRTRRENEATPACPMQSAAAGN